MRAHRGAFHRGAVKSVHASSRPLERTPHNQEQQGQRKAPAAAGQIAGRSQDGWIDDRVHAMRTTVGELPVHSRFIGAVNTERPGPFGAVQSIQYLTQLRPEIPSSAVHQRTQRKVFFVEFKDAKALRLRCVTV